MEVILKSMILYISLQPSLVNHNPINNVNTAFKESKHRMIAIFAKLLIHKLKSLASKVISFNELRN